MSKSIITIENYSYCRYKSDKLKAYISIGAEPLERESTKIQDLYFLTVTEDDYKEVLQRSFKTLPEACLAINEDYGQWQLHNLEFQAKVKKSGCDSCSAH